MKQFIACLTIMFAIGCLTIACGGSGEAGNSAGNNSANAPKAVADLGKKVYKQYCVACHGADGNMGLNGAKKLPESQMSRIEIVQIITKGKGLMTPHETLLEANEIEAVADYVMTMRP